MSEEQKNEQNVTENRDINTEIKENVEEQPETIVAYPETDHLEDEISIAIAKKENENKNNNEKANIKPKLFIKEENEEDLLTIDIDIIFDKDSGEVFSVMRKGLMEPAVIMETGLAVESYYAKFSPVTYDKMVYYRKAASIFDKEAGKMVMNRQTLRTFLVVNHLKEWNIPGEDGEPMKLDFTEKEDGTSNISYTCANRIFQAIPALLDVMLSILERRLMLPLE